VPRSTFLSKPIYNFGGPTRNALKAQNVRYEYSESGTAGVSQCKVRTRAGHSVAFNPGTAVHSMHNSTATDPQASTQHNFVYFYDGTNIKAYNVLASTINALNPPVGVSAAKLSAAEAGTFTYLAAYDSNGIGVGTGYVVDPSLNADTLFQGPPTTSEVTVSIVEPVGAGVVTAGTHKVLFVLSTRNGRTCAPGPIDPITSQVVPGTIVASGGLQLTVTLNGVSWPDSSQSVQLLMSPVDDVDTYYFVPGTTFAVGGGGPFSPSIHVNIDDAALINEPPALNYFNLINAGFFSPSFVVAYRNRMVYGAGDRVYISDPFDFQSITADQHVQTLPGLQTVIGAFPYRDGNLYLVSHEGTFALTDTGDVPVNWTSAQPVDMQIGTKAPQGMTHDPSRNDEWVATPGGLRLFTDGTYQDPPISFWQPDWQRINWAAPDHIEIVDMLEEQCIKILVPLDGATVPTHLMVYDYKSGKTPELIRYALHVISDRHCMCRVLNPTTGRYELWLGPLTPGAVWKQDAALTQDAGTDIAGQIYETSPLLDVEEMGGPAAFHGAHYTARGTALLTLTGFSLYHAKNSGAKTTDLSTVPTGTRTLRQWLMRSENQSLEFKTDAGWFELTEVEVYYTPWIRQR